MLSALDGLHLSIKHCLSMRTANMKRTHNASYGTINGYHAQCERATWSRSRANTCSLWQRCPSRERGEWRRSDARCAPHVCANQAAQVCSDGPAILPKARYSGFLHWLGALAVICRQVCPLRCAHTHRLRPFSTQACLRPVTHTTTELQHEIILEKSSMATPPSSLAFINVRALGQEQVRSKSVAGAADIAVAS